MFKGPEARASVPGRPKVWACREVLGGKPCPLPTPSLPGPQTDDRRMGPDTSGVLGGHVGTLHGCVLVGTVSAHRSVHSLDTQFCGHTGETWMWHVKALCVPGNGLLCTRV